MSKKYKNHFGYTIDEHHCIIKGRLYYPLGNDIPPNGVTKNHLRGSWCYFNTNDKKQNLIPVSKSDWLAELDHADIIKRLQKPERYSTQQAQCFAVYKSNYASTHTQEYQEVNRIFILPENFIFPRRNTSIRNTP